MVLIKVQSCSCHYQPHTNTHKQQTRGYTFNTFAHTRPIRDPGETRLQVQEVPNSQTAELSVQLMYAPQGIKKL